MSRALIEEAKRILLKHIQNEIREGIIDELKTPKIYDNLKEFIAEKIIGVMYNPTIKIEIKEVDKFPVEIKLYTCRPQEGYSSYPSYSKIIKGRFEEKEYENYENQYQYCTYYKGLLYPDDNEIAIIKNEDSWTGYTYYSVYVKSKDTLNNLMKRYNKESRLKINKLAKDKAEQILNERLSKIDEKIFEKILDVVNSIKYSFFDNVEKPSIGCCDCYENLKITILLDKERNPIYLRKIHYEDCQSYKETTTTIELQIEDKIYKILRKNGVYSKWENAGPGGGNYLDEWEETKIEGDEISKIIIWIFETLPKKYKPIYFVSGKKSLFEIEDTIYKIFFQ